MLFERLKYKEIKYFFKHHERVTQNDVICLFTQGSVGQFEKSVCMTKDCFHDNVLINIRTAAARGILMF
ncbi:hypothetical protein CEV08_05545 [Bartonella tribocorum]|uniref:Uncharacterized protein n=1 Tax=Bartonella tribocorum TaxID=85701 RepID=A0A2M6UU55_9HYPH|nr:hypothetical protein CEV08_05545 [Bartonella tribocorum]